MSWRRLIGCSYCCARRWHRRRCAGGGDARRQPPRPTARSWSWSVIRPTITAPTGGYGGRLRRRACAQRAAAPRPPHCRPIWPDPRRRLADADDRRRLLCDGCARTAARPAPRRRAGLARSRCRMGRAGRSSITRAGATPQRSAVRRRARRGAVASRRPAPDRQRPRHDASRSSTAGSTPAIPTLPGRCWSTATSSPGRPLVAEQHGTAVAGIIAAKADNGIGIAGVAPGARLLGLRACWQQARHRDRVRHAQPGQGALFRRREQGRRDQPQPQRPRRAAAARDTRRSRYARGIAVVAAFDPKLPGGGFPASVPGVIAVADMPIGGHRAMTFTPRRAATCRPRSREDDGFSSTAAHLPPLMSAAWSR